MTSVPFPSFVHQRPVVGNRWMALSAVGRCRIFPESCHDNDDHNDHNNNNNDNNTVEDYLAIVAKNVVQAQVNDDNNDNNNNNDHDSKATTTKKRYMKEGVAMAKRYINETLQVDTSMINVEMVVRAEDLLETKGCLASCLLDAGCHAICTDGTNLEAMDICNIPRERMVAHFVLPFQSGSGSSNNAGINDNGSGNDLMQAMQAASSLASCVSVEFAKGKAFSMDDLHQITQFAISKNNHSTNNTNNKVQVVLQFRPQDCILENNNNNTNNTNTNITSNSSSDEDVAKLVGFICRKFKHHDVGTVTLVDPTPRQLGLAYAACLVTDRKDELYTTVVCTRQGEALGLVYSNKESIVAALESGRGVYYSRSRKGLWRKGDTSGHYQTLHRIDVDCDGDALRFMVTQHGGGGGGTDGNGDGNHTVSAFCHLNTLTCWGPPVGVRLLEETLQQRLKDAPAGSYTKRLFDNADLLRNKLVEEAQELAEATTKDDVACELADVLYFAMVRAVKAGVSLDDAVQELDRRTRKVTRRPGDSKSFRIEAGKAILEQAAAAAAAAGKKEEEEE